MAQSGTMTDGVTVQPAGPRLFDPKPVTEGVAQDRGRNTQIGIVASTTQTQAASSATAQMRHGLNTIATVANASDGVALPSATRGSVVHFFNAGANTPTVFGKDGTTDTINSTAGATGVAGPGASKIGIAICVTDGAWQLGATA